MKNILFLLSSIISFSSFGCIENDTVEERIIRSVIDNIRTPAFDGKCTEKEKQYFKLEGKKCTERKEQIIDECEDYLVKHLVRDGSQDFLVKVVEHLTHCQIMKMANCEYTMEVTNTIKEINVEKNISNSFLLEKFSVFDCQYK